MQNNSLIRNSVLALGLSALASPACFASTVYLNSSAVETANNSKSATIDIPVDCSWSQAFNGSSWVSNVQSGSPSAAGYVSPKNGTEVTFTDTFTVSGTPTFAELDVMADDTASVSLNGILLTDLAKGDCSKDASKIGYTTATEGEFNLLGDIHTGVNVLSFTVDQTAGGSFGLDYSGEIVSQSAKDAAVSPEPGTLALFGIPLAILGIMRRRKSKA